MDIQINEVHNLKELRAFIRFPHDLHGGNPQWVPALDFDEMNTLRRDRNPAFEHCQARYWLAISKGRIVGRVAAIYNQLHIQKWGQRSLRFGWIDYIDQVNVTRALMMAVEGWARELGLTAVHGPLGFTDLDREGMLVEGFDELATLSTSHNPPYYPEHLIKLGYKKDVDWVEHEIQLPKTLDPTVARVAEIAEKRNRLRPLEARKKNELLPYAPALFDLINREYEHLYGVVPLTERQIEAYVRQYFGFVHPDYLPVVLNEEGQLVAFTIAMPSLSRALQRSGGRLFPFGFIHLLWALKKNDRLDLYLGAVRSDYQGKGVNAIMMARLYDACKRRGIRTLHANPQLESNRQVQEQWQYFGGRQHKRRRVFIKQLAS